MKRTDRTGNDTFHQGAAPDGADVIVGDHRRRHRRTIRNARQRFRSASTGPRTTETIPRVTTSLLRPCSEGTEMTTLRATALANQLDGNSGNDRITGRPRIRRASMAAPVSTQRITQAARTL